MSAVFQPTARRGQPLVAESVGEPQVLGSLARLLLQMHRQPALRVVERPREEDEREDQAA